jgi:hypothetical protein
MAEAAFIVPLLPVPRTGWRLLCHYYDGDSAARVLMRKNMTFNKIIRIVEQPARADKSAMAAINRALRLAAPIHDIPGISLKFNIGPYG